jgi:hypothetical protein
MMVWIRKDDSPSIMPWNMRYQPVEKRAIPEAITDLGLNLKNRQHAIDDYLYGPMNPNKPGDYWHRLADVWGVDVEEAASTRCGNCAAFNQKPEILSAIADGISDEGDAVTDAAGLGYCELFEFKCAAARSCSAWLTGGPLTKSVDIEKKEECTCWDGYERVPGTAPCESGSCREIKKHGDHDQKSHGRRGGFSGPESDSSVFQQVMGKPEAERGISINIMGKQPTDGYMVAFQGAWQPVPEQEFRDNGRQVIRDYLRKHAKALGGSEKTYMGIWFNTDTRQYEFDLSEQITNKRQAVRVGRTREQEAAWDVKRSEPVFIGARDSTRQAEIDAL